MRVKMVLPRKIIFDKDADKVTAPGTEGFFQILPRHTDVIWSLDSGILIIEAEGKELFFAIDRGMLVKEGKYVTISCFNAISGESLETLSSEVLSDIRKMNEGEREAREALAKLEVETIKRFGNL